MIIESIEIKNFQCFYGLVPAVKLGRGCTVIHGRNGAGKSRLFNAFCWCFMNKFYETKNGWQVVRNSQDLESLISKTAIEKHEAFDVYVEIAFELDDEEIGISDLRLRRSFDVNKAGISSPQVLLSYMEGRDYKETSDQEVVERKLDSWFDHEIRRFMWFQGETLDDLVKFEEKDSLQNLTAKISHYRNYEDLVDTSKLFLNYAKRRREEAQSQNTSNVRLSNQIKSDLLDKRNKLSKQDEYVKVLRKNIELCDRTIASADEIIEKTAESAEKLTSAKVAEAKFDKVGFEWTSLQEQYADRERSGELLALELESVGTFFNDLERLETKIQERKTALGAKNQAISLEVPKESDLEKLIASERCDICGTDAPRDSIPYEHMVARLKEMRAQSERANELRELNRFQSEIPDVVHALDGLIKRATTIHETFLKEEEEVKVRWMHAKTEMQKTKDELVGVPESAGAFDDHKARKERAKREKSKHESDLLGCRDVITTLKNEIRNKERDLDGLTNKDKLDPLFDERKSLAEYAVRLIEQIRDNEREQLLDDIEIEANKVYNELLRGAVGVVSTLTIDRVNMTMDLVDNNGELSADPNSANWMAAKVALVTSVLKLTKERLKRNYPMISDAATSDMDEVNAKNFVRVTSEIFDQTIIISKDFDKSAIAELASSNVKIYSLTPTTLDGKALDGQKASTSDLQVKIIPQS